MPTDSKARGRRRSHGLRAAAPRLSQFALEHLLLLPLGAADRAGVGQHRAGELLPLHLRDRVRRQRRRHGVLFRADDQGGGRSDSAGRRAPSVATGVAAGVAAIGATVVPALIHIRVVDALDEPMLADRLAGAVRDRYRRQLFRRENHLPTASGDPVSAPPRNRVRRARVRRTRAVQSDPETCISPAAS